jgi:hypothetical protein
MMTAFSTKLHHWWLWEALWEAICNHIAEHQPRQYIASIAYNIYGGSNIVRLYGTVSRDFLDWSTAMNQH